MTIRQHYLEQRYTEESGLVLLSGTQALVRLLMLQHSRDLTQGLNTAGYVTGYRGSPLGGVDQVMQTAKSYLQQHNITFHAGINEDLAATAVWGTQQVNLFEGAKYDGVFSLWYGKGPGVDRSCDVLKHGNAAGSSQYGGVLLVVGDDHAAKSSTFPHQSDHALVASMIPVLSPSGIQEVIDFGIHGWAMSRYSGCWVALKAISDTIESSAIVDISPNRLLCTIPEDFDIPPEGLNIRWPDPPLVQEKRLLHHRLYAALAYARANNLNHIVWNSPTARLGIITAGKSYLDVMQALDDLGIDEALAGEIGLNIYKVGMVWPLEPEGIRHFAEGLEEILVVEEKRQIIEYQLKEQLYNWREDVRPRVVGKFLEKGEWALPHDEWLLPAAGELTPAMIAKAIANRLASIFDSPVIHDRLKFYQHKETQLNQHREGLPRLPHYCSGCPHNLSTRVPDGSRALAGIGCHYMSLWIEPHTQTFAQMGGEGVPWIGQAPFTQTQHVFANLGDGTYFHSGLLAIRAAIAAKVNITYKILFNDAVAMTGGQAVDGVLDVPMLTRQLHAEGVSRIVITSDQPEKYNDKHDLALGVQIFHRRELLNIQRELREIPGTTILIHEQICAAEKRRRRKRGKMANSSTRVFINHRVCDACGDCSVQSGCLSILPFDTAQGRKRKIDQSSCNRDLSCVEGFCPSFVTIEGGELISNAFNKSSKYELSPTLPSPTLSALHEPYSILVTGVGGTGVVTIGQVIAMAAHLDNVGVTVLDMAGLAQKGGSVFSHIRLAPTQAALHAVRIAAGDANLVLGCDLVVTASEEALTKMRAGFTTVVLNTFEAPTSAFLTQPNLNFPAKAMKQTISQSVGHAHCIEVNATRLTTEIMHDAIASNMLMLGFAWQKGLIPISEEAILAAIRLNATAVDFNLIAFRWGRQAGYDLAKTEASVANHSIIQFVPRETTENISKLNYALLKTYQNKKLAEKYHTLIMQVREVETRINPESSQLSIAVAKCYAQILTYKDEYEVARLYSDGEFLQEIKQQIRGNFRIKLNLAPYWLTLGKPIKIRFGSWIIPAMKVMSWFRFLRGTRFDPFGWQNDRKLERRLVIYFEQIIHQLISELNAKNYANAVEIIMLMQQIRGYGHIKRENFERVEQAVNHKLQCTKKTQSTQQVA